MAHKDLYMARWLAKRANDLNCGDSFDWIRGHSAFAGKRLNQAIVILEAGLKSTDNKTRITAAGALEELLDHADHVCFNHDAMAALKRFKAQIVFVLQEKRFKTLLVHLSGHEDSTGNPG